MTTLRLRNEANARASLHASTSVAATTVPVSADASSIPLDNVSSLPLDNVSSVPLADVAHEGLRWRRLATGVSQLLGTHAITAFVGLASIPIVARNLGPAGYGQFSLFVLLLGLVTYQDFIRPLLIREWSSSPDAADRERLTALSLVTTWVIASIAVVVGLCLLPWAAALAFALAAGAHSLASVDYARLAAAGRIGFAGAVRNVAFAAATATVAAASFVVRDHPEWLVHAYAWPFAAGNTIIFLVYRRHVGGSGGWKLDARARAAAAAAWRAHHGAITSLVGFGVATAVVVSTDRVLLEHLADDESFGAYAACADLAVKLTVVGTALGMALYPALSSSVARDPRAAARRFVHLAGLVMLGWFALVTTLVAFHREVIALVLGPAFAASHAIYAWILVGVFVHMLGFLLTPWQRARGEFGRQTRAYGVAGAAMIVVGLLAIPRFGAAGAVACYLTGRTAEILILVGEARALTRDVLPLRKLAWLAAMIACVGATAWWTSGGGA